MDDAVPFAIMVIHGIRDDCGFGNGCSNWITEWIIVAKYFVLRDNLNIDYLTYAIILKGGAVVVGYNGCFCYKVVSPTAK